MCSRENTVLRGELFEQSGSNPPTVSVRKNVYVIPNAIVTERFRPAPVKVTEKSESSQNFPGGKI